MTGFLYEYTPYIGQKGEEIPAFGILNKEGEKVAETNENMPVDQQEKIAFLLSAAPDLLEALEAVRDWCIDVEENGKTYKNTNIQKAIVWAKVRRAVNKAIGKGHQK